MTEAKVGLGSVKRFGARYGRKPKVKFSKIETEQRKLHKCPYCSKVAVKRVALGIWKCRKCEAKFTGKAYSVSRVIIPKESDEGKKEIEIVTRKQQMEEEELPEEETSA